MTRPAARTRWACSRPIVLVLAAALSLAARPALAAVGAGGDAVGAGASGAGAAGDGAAGDGAVGGAEKQGLHVVSWGSVEVAAAPKLVFAVLTDYDRMARFLPGMLTSKVVSRDARTVVVEQTADEGFLFFKQRVTARLALEEFPPNRLTVRALGGSFKELTGLYVLTRRQDRTLIEYNARFIPEFELPPMVGMFAVQHSLERHLDGLAAEIRRRSAASERSMRVSPEPGAPGPGE